MIPTPMRSKNTVRTATATTRLVSMPNPLALPPESLAGADRDQLLPSPLAHARFGRSQRSTHENSRVSGQADLRALRGARPQRISGPYGGRGGGRRQAPHRRNQDPGGGGQGANPRRRTRQRGRRQARQE